MNKLIISLLVIVVSTALYFAVDSLPAKSPQAPSTLGQVTSTPQVITTPTPTSQPIPKQYIISGGKHYFQTFNNCGPAALSMALSHYDINVSQKQLGQEMRPYQNQKGDNDDKSVTLDEVAAKAEEKGFIVYHRPAGDMQILKQLIATDLPVLVRTWLKTNEDIGHFRLIKGYDDLKQEITQDDSLQGANLQYSYTEFLKLWEPFNYEFLVIVPKEKQEQVEIILHELLDEKAAWQKSLSIADSLLERNPQDTNAQFNKSVALYYLDEYEQSIEYYESVESKLPFRTLWYQLEPILAYYKVGDYQKVLTLSDKVLNNQNRAYSELHYLKGLVYQQQGNTQTAKDAFDKANLYNTSGSWKNNLQGI